MAVLLFLDSSVQNTSISKDLAAPKRHKAWRVVRVDWMMFFLARDLNLRSLQGDISVLLLTDSFLSVELQYVAYFFYVLSSNAFLKKT